MACIVLSEMGAFPFIAKQKACNFFPAIIYIVRFLCKFILGIQEAHFVFVREN